MALRPRSHQLEDESINAFKQIIPSQWVVREKSRDYGIDLEVEIFDQQSRSTGMSFLVQLKSTDDKAGRKIVLKQGYLEDICSHDSPAIIAKFYSRDGTIFWEWAADMLNDIPDEQVSKTFHFEEPQLLCAEALDEIHAALRINRFCDNFPVDQPIPVHLIFTGIQGKRRLDIKRSLEKIGNKDRAAIKFVSGSQENETVPLVAELFEDAIQISFGPRYSGRIVIDDTLDNDETAARVLYAIGFILCRSNMLVHAEHHSLTLLQLGIKTESRFLGLENVKSIIHDFKAYIDLSILNELHSVQDELYLGVVLGLLNREGDRTEISNQCIRFLDYALKSAQSEGSHTQATILYSMANAARKTDVMFAYSLYMKAKRKWSQYLDTDYFLREVAGCLFTLGRFRLAKKIYELSELEKDHPQDSLLMGDACLFANAFQEAEGYLSIAADSDSLPISAQARLKLLLCEMLKDESGPAYHASAIADRFNHGVDLIKDGENRGAMMQFLTCCFLVPCDYEGWINSVVCCLNLNDPELLSDVLTAGFSLEGEDLLDGLVEYLDNHSASDQIYDTLTEHYSAVQNETGGESWRAPFLFSKLSGNLDISVEAH